MTYPDFCHLLRIRREKDVLLHRDNGRVQDQRILLLLLDGICSGIHDGSFSSNNLILLKNINAIYRMNKPNILVIRII